MFSNNGEIRRDEKCLDFIGGLGEKDKIYTYVSMLLNARLKLIDLTIWVCRFVMDKAEIKNGHILLNRNRFVTKVVIA
jgi:hypothetical protein